MRNYTILPVILLLLTLFVKVQAETTHFESTTFKVYGNCEMCKSRIESTLLKNSNIQSATWDMSTKMLTVVFNPHAMSVDDIHKIIADAGHDTDKLSADDKVYKKMMKCCRYKRK